MAGDDGSIPAAIVGGNNGNTTSKQRAVFTDRPPLRYRARQAKAILPRGRRELEGAANSGCAPRGGAPRTQFESTLLEHDVADSNVRNRTAGHRKPFSRTWRAFLENHVPDIVAIEFFVVATMSLRLLYCFLVLRHDRRRIVHFNVIPCPTARWTAQQVVEAFPFDEAPRFLIRDHDGIYGQDFRERVKHLGIDEVVIAYRSPWQSPYVERLIGSIRRECLDHVIVFNEAHLLRILTDYFAYYHQARSHLSLERNAPNRVTSSCPAVGASSRFRR